MYKVMIVEDDEIISNSIAGYLQKINIIFKIPIFNKKTEITQK